MIKNIFTKASLIVAGIVGLAFPSAAASQEFDPKATTQLTDPNYAFSRIGDLVSTLITIVLFLGAITAFFMLAVGALQWITARGGDGAAKGRATMKYAIIGLIAISLTYVGIIFINTILPQAG